MIGNLSGWILEQKNLPPRCKAARHKAVRGAALLTGARCELVVPIPTTSFWADNSSRAIETIYCCTVKIRKCHEVAPPLQAGGVLHDTSDAMLLYVDSSIAAEKYKKYRIGDVGDGFILC